MSLDLAAHVAFVENEFRRQFRSVIDQITLPIPRRVDQFTCWPGLRVAAASSDGQLRLSFKSNPSKLRIGEHIYVNDLTVEPKDVISGPQGIIQALDEAKGELVIRPGFQQQNRFERRFQREDRVVLDQCLPGEHTSRELPILALRMLAGELGGAPRLDRIRGLLEGTLRARPSGNAPVDDSDPKVQRLTQAQRRALDAAIENDFALVQGPPGTGKTFLLGLIIRELVSRGLRVGVCAFTHQAINNVLAECLRHPEIEEVCKIGSTNKWVGERPERLRHVERAASFFRNKGTPPVTGFTQYAAFNPVARALSDDLEKALMERFDVIVFDEAGQLTLPAALMAMVHAERFIFAGDHKQLPPVVSTTRSRTGPGSSVFRLLVEEAKHEVVLLDETFRLNEELAAFPSEVFYDGRLRSTETAAGRRLEAEFPEPWHRLLDPERPDQLALVRHEGRGQEAPEEAALAAGLVEAALKAGIPPEEIAVVSPHRRQNVRIREFLARLGLAGEHPVVDTVERIQGQERDLIILSMTLSDPELLSAESEFLFLPNRFNVAITRARKKLLVLASPAFFRALPRQAGIEGEALRLLREINVLKRWYFQHRSDAEDASALAFQQLERLTRAAAEAAGPAHA